jgi:hypothetical protein
MRACAMCLKSRLATGTGRRDPQMSDSALLRNFCLQIFESVVIRREFRVRWIKHVNGRHVSAFFYFFLKCLFYSVLYTE